MRIRYSIFLYILMPLVFLYLTMRSTREPAYRRRWLERLGFSQMKLAAQPLWLHAASVGEVQAALPLVRALQRRYPDMPLLVTTTTPTGSDQVRAVFGDSVRHLYAPFDLPGAVNRFLDRTRPRLVAVMETELWPNLFHALDARDIPLLVVNARLSPRTTRSYQRLGGLTRATIGCVDVIAAQSPADAERYASLGATAQQLVTTGNIKFDMTLSDHLAQAGQALRAGFGGERPVWIAASTHEGEDEQVLAAHRELLGRYPDLLLILVPRHPERFERVAALCREQGFALARRSQGGTGADAQVYLGDTMGELMQMYAAADIAFVGGSLVPIGGHNLLEPAALRLAPLSGPHLFNFQQIAELLTAVGALTLVESAAALADEVKRLLAEPAARQGAGERARQMVEANRGALMRTLDLIALQLPAKAASS